MFTITRHPLQALDTVIDPTSEGSREATLSGKAAELPHDPTEHKESSLSIQAQEAFGDLVAAVPSSIFDFTSRLLDKGEVVPLADFKGKVSLVVNVASQCGFTDVNYKELEILYEKYREKGFVVLAFPCNQFGQQEPGTPSEISAIAHQKYHATFPIFEKVDVNGKNSHPLFQFLRGQFGMKQIPWNFQKFVVDQNGLPVHQVLIL